MDTETVVDVVEDAVPSLNVPPVVVGVALVAVGALGMRWWMKKTQKNALLIVKDEPDTEDK